MRKIAAPSMMEITQHNQPASRWLAHTLCAISGVRGWPSLLAVWELSTACSQNRTVGQISVLLSSCMISIPTSMATFFTSPLYKGRGDGGNRLTGIHRMSHLVQGVQTSHIFIYEHLQWIQISLYSGSIWRDLCSHFSHRCPCYRISIMFHSIFHYYIFTIQPSYWPLPMNSHISYIWTSSFPSKVRNHV